MADGVYASMEGVQTTASDPVLDRPSPNPELAQLRPRHDPVLTARELGNRPVHITRPMLSIHDMLMFGGVGHPAEYGPVGVT